MHFFRHALRSLPFSSTSTAAAAATALVTSSVVASTRLETAPSTGQANQNAQPLEFIGVFVDKASAARLTERFPIKFERVATSGDNGNDENLYVVLKFNPTDQEKQVFGPLLGQDAQLEVVAYAEDPNNQAVLVKITTPSGDPITFDAGAEHAHVTMSSAVEGAVGLSNVLLERLRANEKLKFLLEEEAGDEEAEWIGELPEFKSTYFPLYNPFPAVEAKVVSLKTQKSKEEPLELKGKVCLSSAYDPETETCAAASEKPECGFCKFMKAGPCGKEFIAWEACLDRCKANGQDFIEHCGKETLGLRDCVDANPEYYHVLNDPPEEDGAAEGKKEQ